MAIYTDNPPIAIRNGPCDPERLRELVNAIAKKRERGNSKYYFDGRETSDNDPNAVMGFFPNRLPSLKHFRVCDRNENVWEVSLGLDRKYDPNILKRWTAFCIELPRPQIRKHFLNCFVNYTGAPCKDMYGEYDIGVRWDPPPQANGVKLALGQFGGQELEYELTDDITATFFTKAISDAGLAPWVSLKHEERGYDVYGESPWRVEAINRNQHRKSPSTLNIGPFESFQAAWESAERALFGPAVKRIDNLSLHLVMNPIEYETLRERFNNLASGWEVYLYGSYAEGIDPYTADASQSPDGRFPIFMWQPARDANGLYYQADIVPTPEGRYLEIHSNCGDLKRLLKEAETTTGVRFTPVVE